MVQNEGKEQICPYCKKLNVNLNLEETDGSYECIACGKVTKVKGISRNGRWIPLLSPEDLVRKFGKTPSFAEVMAKQ